MRSYVEMIDTWMFEGLEYALVYNAEDGVHELLGGGEMNPDEAFEVLAWRLNELAEERQ